VAQVATLAVALAVWPGAYAMARSRHGASTGSVDA
jgi:hypothetical protein